MSAPLTPLLTRVEATPPGQNGTRPWLRSLGLAACFLACGAFYLQLGKLVPTDPNSSASIVPFVHLWQWIFLPYAVACALILLLRPTRGRWRWIELGLILSGALLLRLELLGLPPNLSHDSWRYVWDARAFLHGYSPYVTLPEAPQLLPLRDFIYAYSRFRNAPSIYPPGAQYIYALSYLLVPSSLFFLKGVFMFFDLLGCLLLTLLLVRRGLDPARVLLYAWSPLPIVEFALEGHLDGVAIAFSLLAVLSASSLNWRGRTLTGFLVGFATLVKIYPLVLLVPLMNVKRWKWADGTWQRDLLLVLTCVLTIGLSYIPFVWLGQGQIFGFFATFASEQGQNAGLVQHFVGAIATGSGLPQDLVVTWEHSVALVLLVGASLAILIARARERLSLAAGTLILFSLMLAISPHVFPWYVTTLLPWIVLLLPARVAPRSSAFWACILVLGSLWLFTFTSVWGYVLSWPDYYLLVDNSLTCELLVSGLLVLLPFWLPFARKGWVYVKQWFNHRF
ncbi:MAG TPA: glycosyltransferase 87 family protein [Ktedonobacteraceae bacterium]